MYGTSRWFGAVTGELMQGPWIRFKALLAQRRDAEVSRIGDPFSCELAAQFRWRYSGDLWLKCGSVCPTRQKSRLPRSCHCGRASRWKKSSAQKMMILLRR